MGKKIISAILAAIMLVSIPIVASASSIVKTKSIKLNVTSIKLDENRTRQLYVTYTPFNATDKTLVWKSSNEDVATVTANGLVEGIKAGEARIYVTSAAAGKMISCKVTVLDPDKDIPVKKIEISFDEIDLSVDSKRQLIAFLTPVDASSDYLVWSSSNYEIATVDHEGVVTGISPGTASITVEAESGARTTCKVHVSAYISDFYSDDRDITDLPPVKSANVLTSKAARSEIELKAKNARAGAQITAQFADIRQIDSVVANAAVYAAEKANVAVRMRFDTTDISGKTKAMLAFRLADAKSYIDTFLTGVFDDSSKALGTIRRFQKFFTNDIQVVELEQYGNFGFSAEVAFKLGINTSNTNNLYFYSYDYAKNKFDSLSVSNVIIDKNGYLHFNTSVGGIIVISKGGIQKK